MSDEGSGCKSCAEVILKEYFAQKDEDHDGVIIDWPQVYKLVMEGKSVEEAVISASEFLPGSWLCKYLTFKYIGEELEKGRTLAEILDEMKKKEPLRYRGCVLGEGIIYEIEGV